MSLWPLDPFQGKLTTSVAILGLVLPSSAHCKARLLKACGCIFGGWLPFLGPLGFLGFSFPSSLWGGVR